MKIIAIAFRYLFSRPLAAGLNLMLLSLSLASITFVLLTAEQMDKTFERDLAGIDLVVGAKGSPMQLILAGVFHIDVPPGNIPLAAVKELAKNPQVARLIPLSLGDSYKGFRIVGTTAAYAAHYNTPLAQGSLWSRAMQVVLGSQVAQDTGLQVGASFAGSHGLGGAGKTHADNPYVVTGIMAPCGCVLDRLILTATESVWHVHEVHAAAPGIPDQVDHDDDKHDDKHGGGEDDSKREVTLALITYTSPLAAVSLPRFINTTTAMQAAAPAVEITRLLRMVGVGTDVLRGFGAVLLLTAGLSVFIALWNAVRERRADLAMLRMLGASPQKVASLVLCEALLLALLATVLGLLMGHTLTALVGQWLQAERSVSLTGWTWLSAEWWVPVLALGVAILAALLPTLQAYRLDVTTLLNSR
jgi:putative ABC transport system permease protein